MKYCPQCGVPISDDLSRCQCCELTNQEADQDYQNLLTGEDPENWVGPSGKFLGYDRIREMEEGPAVAR